MNGQMCSAKVNKCLHCGSEVVVYLTQYDIQLMQWSKTYRTISLCTSWSTASIPRQSCFSASERLATYSSLDYPNHSNKKKKKIINLVLD